MPHEIGFVQNSGVLAHYMMLDKIKTFAEANGWTTLRYDTGINREVILKGPGYTGTEEIFVGFLCYQDAGSDYYNISVGVFTGYVAGNTFATQPGAMINSACAHNTRIDYWLVVTPQRITVVMKVGTPVYDVMYAGKILPYARPSQYPYPVLCAGTLSAAPNTRYSDTARQMPWVGNIANCNLRIPSGIWSQPECYPWNNTGMLAGTTSSARDTNNNYQLIPATLMTSALGLLGEVEGIFHVSGFSNAVENTITISGVLYVVIQNVYRTGFNSFYAIRMDT